MSTQSRRQGAAISDAVAGASKKTVQPIMFAGSLFLLFGFIWFVLVIASYHVSVEPNLLSMANGLLITVVFELFGIALILLGKK
jgi:hypothetical protein